MDKELQELKEKIKEIVNKYDIRDFNVEIFKLYDKKTIILNVDGEWK